MPRSKEEVKALIQSISERYEVIFKEPMPSAALQVWTNKRYEELQNGFFTSFLGHLQQDDVAILHSLVKEDLGKPREKVPAQNRSGR